jgi:hypothetical protein
MPYCTIVEFEWDETFDYRGFAELAEPDKVAEGRLTRIASIDATGARMIEVWRSGADARAFAEKSAPSLAAVQLPPPSLVQGFEVTSYVVA